MTTTPSSALASAGDAELVAGIIRRQPGALAEAHARHAGLAHRVAVRTCGSLLAVEVVQEVFLRLWQHPDRYRPDRGSLQAFLLLDTHGRAVDLARKEAAGRARETGGRRPAEAADIETQVLAGLDRDAVAIALAALPEAERRAIVMAFFGGRTYREVALDLDEPEGTVKGRIRRGLEHLRAGLLVESQDMDEPDRPSVDLQDAADELSST